MANDSVDRRLVEIISNLLRRTQKGGVTWEVGPFPGRDTYVYHTAHATLEIRSRDNDGVSPFEFIVRDDNGNILERLISDPINDEYNEMVASLYTLARRQSLNVDQTLDNLVSELKEEEESE